MIVLAFFVVLELFPSLVLETVLYAWAVGVSQVVLLVSVAFWAWLWGPLGWLMASPLTVCLVVLGKHVPGLAFVGLLMDDTPALAPEYGFYQRLVARDQAALKGIHGHIREGDVRHEHPGSTVVYRPGRLQMVHATGRRRDCDRNA